MKNSLLIIARRVGFDIDDREFRQFSRNVAGSLLNQTAYTIFGVITGILLARLLGPDELGVYAGAFALASLLAIVASSGVPTALTRLLASYIVRAEYNHVRACVAWGYRYVAFLSTAFAGAGVFFVLWSGWIGEQARPTYVVAMAMIPLISIAAVQRGVLQGMQKAVLSQVPEFLVRSGLLCLALIICMQLGNPIENAPERAMALHLGACACGLLAGRVMIAQAAPPYMRSGAAVANSRSWRRLSLSLNNVDLALIVTSQAGLVLMPLFVAPSEVGIFHVAYLASALVKLPLVATNTPLFPMLARLFTSGNFRKMQTMITLSTRLSVMACLPVMLLYVIFGDTVINTIFGEQFAAAYFPLFILTLGQIVTIAAGAGDGILRMTGYQNDATIALSISAAVQVVLTLGLVPMFGACGAATAQASAAILCSYLLFRRVTRRLSIDPSFVGRRTLRKTGCDDG